MKKYWMLRFYARWSLDARSSGALDKGASLERGILRSSEEAKSGISRFVSQVRTKHLTIQNSTSWAQILGKHFKLNVLQVSKANLHMQGPRVDQSKPFSTHFQEHFANMQCMIFKSIFSFKSCSIELNSWKTNWKHGLKLKHEHACTILPWIQLKTH